MNEDAGGVSHQKVLNSPLDSNLAVLVFINGDHGGPQFFCIASHRHGGGGGSGGFDWEEEYGGGFDYNNLKRKNNQKQYE